MVLGYLEGNFAPFVSQPPRDFFAEPCFRFRHNFQSLHEFYYILSPNHQTKVPSWKKIYFSVLSQGGLSHTIASEQNIKRSTFHCIFVALLRLFAAKTEPA
jgi:hypothetical protein